MDVGKLPNLCVPQFIHLQTGWCCGDFTAYGNVPSMANLSKWWPVCTLHTRQ